MPCYVFDACIIMNLEKTRLLQDFERYCRETSSSVKMATVNHGELHRTTRETIGRWPFLTVFQPNQATVKALAVEHRASPHAHGETRDISEKDLSVLAAALETSCKTFCVTNDAALLTGIYAYLGRHPEQRSIAPLAFAGLLLSMHESDRKGCDPRWLVDSSNKAIEMVECGRIFNGITKLRWIEKDAMNVFKPYTVNYKKAVSYGV